jgi:iron complex transport system permease protein
MSRRVVLRHSGTDVSFRVAIRPLVVVAVLAVMIFVGICLVTAYGVYPISPLDAARAVIGTGNRIQLLVVRELRLPRVLMGAMVGGALGLCGAVFQTLSRNPLASPDILGINEGASVVAIFMIIHGAPATVVPFGAFGGSCAVIALLALLGVRRHFSMSRVLLIGVAINMLCGLLIQYISRTPIPPNRLVTEQNWLAGNIAGADWFQIRLLAVGMVIFVPIVLALGRQLNAFQLGDDIATSLGVRTRALQLGLLFAAAFLSAVVVSVVGPVGFVAFIAPHIARRLTRTGSAISFPAAIGVGAVLVIVADYAAKRIVEPQQLPIGFTMAAIGAPYLLYLVIRTERDTGVA